MSFWPRLALMFMIKGKVYFEKCSSHDILGVFVFKFLAKKKHKAFWNLGMIVYITLTTVTIILMTISCRYRPFKVLSASVSVLKLCLLKFCNYNASLNILGCVVCYQNIYFFLHLQNDNHLHLDENIKKMLSHSNCYAILFNNITFWCIMKLIILSICAE